MSTGATSSRAEPLRHTNTTDLSGTTMDIKACLLTTAWLLPLVGFAVEIFGG